MRGGADDRQPMGATTCAAPGVNGLLVGMAFGGAASQLAREAASRETQDMAEDDRARKLQEIDRVLNDPDVPMQPALVWRLLAEISAQGPQADVMPPQPVARRRGRPTRQAESAAEN